MRLSILFLFFSIGMSFAGNTYAQNKLISLNVKNSSVGSILEQVEKQSDFTFVYDAHQVNTARNASVAVENKNIYEVLTQLFDNSDIVFTVVNKKIVLNTKEELPIALQQPQTRRITGTVTDEKGEPIIGANVIVQGTNMGVITDLNGVFSLDIPTGNKQLQISFIGYLTQYLDITEGTKFSVILKESINVLDEIVVVGYGALDKKVMTNAVTKIKSENFTSGTTSPLMAIQGKVAGLSVQSTNGSDPNANQSIQLRGANSINADMGPLIVIDGVPGAEMALVAKEDIESITVLKDASAAAIYGTRASGGVILVTTKRPQIGKAQINFVSELSTETVRKKPDILTADEFRSYGKADRDTPGDGGYNYGGSTNWYDKILRSTPLSQRYVISASGGTENARVGGSVTVRDAKGMAITSTRKELSGRLNTYFKFLDDRLELISNISYSEINSNLIDNEIFEKAMTLNPTYPLYSDQYESGYNMILNQSQLFNPVAEVKLKNNNLESTLLLANSTLKLNLTDFWSVSAMVAAKRTSAYQVQYRSAQHRISLENGVKGWGSEDYKRYIDKTFDLTSNLDKTFGDHTINAVAGYSFQEFNGQGFGADNQNFLVDYIGVNNLGSGSYLSEGKANMGSFKDVRTRLIAFLGRINYAYKDRYLLTLTTRYEGSSKFYQNKWGTFPGISAGWRISSENFMENVKFINDLKIRGAYGETGNAGFSSVNAFRMFSLDSWTYVNGQWMRVYGLQHNQVKDMKWEVKKELDFGLDYAVLNNKLTGRFDWYNRKVDRLIYVIPVASPPNVYGSSQTNAGNMENTGFEFELSWNAINKKNFTYNTTIVASTNNTKLKTLGIGNAYVDLHTLPHPGSPGTAVRIQPGTEIGKFFLFKSAGYDENGMALIYDKDENIIPYDRRNPETDRRYIGKSIPKLTLSWGHDLRYKQWDLNIYMRSWLGYDVFNVNEMYYGIPTSLSNGRNVLKDAVTKNAFISKDNPRLLTDEWLENGSFLKVDVITLGYTFNRKMIRPLANARIYLTGRDLFTITGYKGLDPEINVNGLEPGFEDVNAYPRTRTFMLGIQIGF
ncbi:SusC/RagA family TonB-linked outer membrane protein [Parabacteroides sp. Marseille-P3160]|uniref:SusC/RagA family TonB-linked outer membrane protein n=1 Tax=Parabacteroides sp. Marseille-P3160 TaxID=1917887 RepID=UPI001359A8AB|nr:SusC/RagA family TonB-linked outer membrane protein [Parabacteroides sp. Marseille-P3160]